MTVRIDPGVPQLGGDPLLVQIGFTRFESAMPDIDGALVGGASLKPDDFAALVRYS